MLVRPDVPVAAVDGAAFSAPVWTGELLVGSAHTRHSAGRWGYAVTCNVGMDGQHHAGRVALESLGEDAPESRSIALFDWRRGRIEVLGSADAYDVSLDAAGWDYRSSRRCFRATSP